MLLFAHPADAQSFLPAAPAEWVYNAIPTVVGQYGPNFAGLPSIVVPAVSGAQHVVDCVSVSVGLTNPAVASGSYVILQLQDGVAGSKPLMQWAFFPSGTTPQIVNLCGLSVVGSVGNAMTLEFVDGASGGETYNNTTTTYASLNLVGHDAQ